MNEDSEDKIQSTTDCFNDGSKRNEALKALNWWQ